MNQIKTAFAQVKKYHFWVLCGVIAVVGLGSWYMSSASLQTEFAANKGAIEGADGAVKALLSQAKPPNPKVHQGMELRIAELQQSVARTWKAQYDHQLTTTLTWPTELTVKFRKAVEPLRPIEEKFPEFPVPPEKEIARDLRAEYANYIEQELPKLAKVIGAKWVATAPSGAGVMGAGYGGDMTSGYSDSGGEYASGYGTMGSGYGGAYGATGYGNPQMQKPVEEVVVDWNTSNQSQLMTKFSWSKQGVPTTLEVLYAQEELWVLKNLMEIIKNTNDGATERHRAYIKKIESIQLGREAAGRTGKITPVLAVAASSTMGMGYGYEGESYGMTSGSEDYSTMEGGGLPSGSESSPGYGGTMGGTGTAMSPDPANFRYVDKDYKPLEASKIRSDVTTNPAEVYLAVAKRMPVRLVCQIDQRKIHKLLAECGNSPLTVEVRQVRIGGNAGKGGGGMMGGYGSSYGGMSDSGYGGSSDSGYGTFTSGAEGGESGYGMSMGGYGGTMGAASNQAVYDVTVEVYGIVYIYNPVNLKALGVDPAKTPTTASQPGAVTADAGANRRRS